MTKVLIANVSVKIPYITSNKNFGKQNIYKWIPQSPKKQKIKVNHGK